MSNVRDFGATGDGVTDDTAAIAHCIAQGDGVLQLPRGVYRITRTIPIALDDVGRTAVDGSQGTAKVIMAGAGPAFALIGTHDGTADPSDFKPNVWLRQRMPTVLNVEIQGEHPEADGLLVEGTMQSTFQGVLLRELRHGIHLHKRARNVIITGCHIYHNTGVGVFLDHVNLHQTNISANHISYCRLGGIRIEGSVIRNLQITGNDIEYNNHRSFDADPQPTADIWIDASEEGASVREGTIDSNTLQATYSPGGANVRMIGRADKVTGGHKAGMFTITGNLIGSQEINVHLVACRGVVVTGNVIYSGHQRNLQLDACRNVVVGPNSFDHNPDYRDKELCTGVSLNDSQNITFTGSCIQDCQAGKHTVDTPAVIDRKALLEIIRCKRVNVTGCQVLDAYPAGIYMDSPQHVSVTGCTVLDTRDAKLMQAAIRCKGGGQGNLISGNTLGQGTADALDIDPAAGVKVGDNLSHGERSAAISGGPPGEGARG